MVIQQGTKWARHVIHAIVPTGVRYRKADAGITVCSLLALSGNPAAPEFVRFWTIADKARFSPGAVCLLLVQAGLVLI
jgi:hypothetical protein